MKTYKQVVEKTQKHGGSIKGFQTKKSKNASMKRTMNLFIGDQVRKILDPRGRKFSY